MRSLQQEEKNQENKGKESANSFSQTRAVGVVKLAAGHMINVMRSAAAGIVDAQTICPQLVQGLKKEEKGESSPQKPRVQKVEGEDSSSTSSRLKDEDTMSEVFGHEGALGTRQHHAQVVDYDFYINFFELYWNLRQNPKKLSCLVFNNNWIN